MRLFSEFYYLSLSYSGSKRARPVQGFSIEMLSSRTLEIAIQIEIELRTESVTIERQLGRVNGDTILFRSARLHLKLPDSTVRDQADEVKGSAFDTFRRLCESGRACAEFSFCI